MKKTISSLLIVALAAPAFPLRAEMIGAEANYRERIAAAFEREDVRVELQARGVDPAHAKARVAALTDEEARLLAAEIDSLPAGGFVQVVQGVGFLLYAIGFVISIAVVGTVALIQAAVRNERNSRSVPRGEAQ